MAPRKMFYFLVAAEGVEKCQHTKGAVMKPSEGDR